MSKPKSIMAIIPVDRPPDAILFAGSHLPDEKHGGLYVPTNFLVATWHEDKSTLQLLIVTENPRHERKLTKDLMSARKGSKIQARKAALCKRIIKP